MRMIRVSVTKGMMKKMSNRGCGCRGCYYYKPIYRGVNALLCCHYLLIEDEKRGCPPGKNCSRRLELDEESAEIKDRKYVNDSYNWRYY